MLGEADDICAAIREVDKDSEARNTGGLAFVAGAVVAKKSDPTKVYVVGLMAANERGHDVDESGVEESDIKLVMDQAQVSRGKAIKALKANKMAEEDDSE